MPDKNRRDRVRTKLIRLAHANPEIRPLVLPMLTQTKQAGFFSARTPLQKVDLTTLGSFAEIWAKLPTKAKIEAQRLLDASAEREFGHLDLDKNAAILAANALKDIYPAVKQALLDWYDHQSSEWTMI